MKLEQQFTAAMLAAGNQRSSVKSYWPHVVGFCQFVRHKHGRWVHPRDTNSADVYAWRQHLAYRMHLSPKTINQAVSALKFLFKRVLEKPIEELTDNPLRAREPRRQRRRLISKTDLSKLFDAMRPSDRLVAQLAYASVSRLDDVLSLRIKDLNFADEQIQIASTKHHHFRIVPFPRSIHDSVQRQLDFASVMHQQDQVDNPNGVPVPYAFDRKSPKAPHELAWFWLFPSGNLSRDPQDGRIKRYHRDADHFRRLFKKAVKRAGINRRITPHDLRRSAATHLHLAGMPLKRLKDILGHNSLKTTELYIMDDDTEINGSHSPFDLLPK